MSTEEARLKVVPQWSDIFGSNKSSASNCHTMSPIRETATADQKISTPRYQATPPSSTTNDARVEALGQRLKKAFVQLREETELDMPKRVPKDSSWSKRITDDIVKVVELSQRQNGAKGLLSHQKLMLSVFLSGN